MNKKAYLEGVIVVFRLQQRIRGGGQLGFQESSIPEVDVMILPGGGYLNLQNTRILPGGGHVGLHTIKALNWR
jgi:hypothetical protein